MDNYACLLLRSGNIRELVAYGDMLARRLSIFVDKYVMLEKYKALEETMRIKLSIFCFVLTSP